jgi:Lysine methyltransferase
MRDRIQHRRASLWLVVALVHHVCSLSSGSGNIDFRKSTLLSWDDKVVLGHCLEERSEDVMKVRVWLERDNPEDLILNFPERAMVGEGLASQFWPAALASSILLRSTELQSWMTNKSLAELGCGRGLAGLAAASNAQSCLLTDNDAEAVFVLQSRTCPGNQDQLKAKLKTRQLDWRDDHRGEVPKVDLVLGSDVAYYYYLLRPFMNTARAFMDHDDDDSTEPATLMVIGQANRESQWELYKNIVNGCYNQLTDLHEPPWPGTCRMLLYQLQMSEWCPTLKECQERSDGTIPISVIVHHDETSDENSGVPSPFEEYAHLATLEDDDSIMKTF